MKKIAIIEDNPDNRLLINAILDEMFDMVEYETGIEALDAFQSDIPDLILLDISLPVMDGVEVLQRLKTNEHLKHLPVIALTAHAMSGDREKYLNVGFDEYVSKPIVDEDVLIKAIQRLVGEA